MAKKPSLNILHKDLKRVLSRIDELKSHDIDDLFNKIINGSRKYPLRRFIVSNATISKRLQNISDDVELFHTALNSSRVKRGHRPRQILKGDKLYSTLSKVANDAREFRDHFELNSFDEYLNIGLDKIGKNYRLNKFITYKDQLFETYEKTLAVNNNQHKQLTYDVWNYFLEKYGILDEDQSINIWEIYAHDFVYTAEQIFEYKCSVNEWIDAQFKGMEYLKTKPEPYQLHTPEATKRFLANKPVKKASWRDKISKKIK